jgi:opacity protein-like surface antigen
MRIWVLICLLLLGVASRAAADDGWGKNDLFYGFSYVNAQLASERTSMYGGGINYARYLWKDHLAAVGDFSIQFRKDLRLLYFLGGARYYFQGENVNPFVEGLIGASSLHPESGTQTAAAYGFGVGANIRVWDTVAIRPQFNYLQGSYKNADFHDVRFMIGFGWRF